jgi:hypothetical protein
MAEMIPDRIPQRASAGEKKLFSILQKLPDDYIVYYEPIIEDPYPDFIVICPDLGLLVIEVKGWYPKDILAADANSVLVKELRQEIYRNHPVRQAQDYLLSLIDECRNHRYGERLLQKEGEHQNRFIFPFGHFAVLSNITETQLKAHTLGDLTTVFPANQVVTRNIVESWTDDSLSGEDICQIFQSYFNPTWEFPPLKETQVDTIRAIVHPEIILPTKTHEIEPEDIKVLDLRQENNARNIGDGHRIIYGVAGSGKTVLLLAKARLLSSQKPEAQILFLCYNVTLASYLETALGDCINVEVRHFDGWAKANGCPRRIGESDNDEFGERFLKVLEQGCFDSRRYDAVMIDESQDFAISWFKCVLEAMKEPSDGDLVIVGDGSQGLYGLTKVRWKQIGIQAKGRTIYTKFDLDKNYRNSREIIELASLFATPPEHDEEAEDALISIAVSPEKCQRYTGFKPVMIKSSNRQEELAKILTIVKDLMDGNWFGKSIKPLTAEEIAIFYTFLLKKDRPLMQWLIEGLTDIAPVVWLTNPGDSYARTRLTDPGIKIQTIHSAKGLQYRAVILMWADQLPRQFGDTNQQDERCLMYVALTRPEDFLVISTSNYSTFMEEIEESISVEFA